ncbi:YraN family protein [Acinetobacter tandoii]|nr:YraN family protein [Acinetobacter tandoii]
MKIKINACKKNGSEKSSGKTTAQALGDWAEKEALMLLQQQGFHLVQQNYHSRYGELDLVVQQGEELLLVEVKARALTRFGHANEVVSASKQRKLIKTALCFLHEYPEYEQFYCRFDVICFDFYQQFSKTVQYDFSSFTYDLHWIENAFTFDSEFINL